jgi:hypothetical protein
MRITELKSTIEKIEKSIHEITGKKLHCKICNIIDAARFPDDLIDTDGTEKIGPIKAGLYVFSAKESGIIHYVGISNDVVARFWKHVGGGLNWERDGKQARFPECTLVAGREEWLINDIKEIFQNAKFNVTFIIPDSKDSKGLIEQYLIYYAWATNPQEALSINVML